MRVLFTCQPGFGHFNDMLGLARACQRAGHPVAFATARSFGPKVEAAGVTALPAGLDWEESRPDTLPELRAINGPQGFAIFIELARRGMVDDLVELGRSWQPDLIVRGATEFGGWIAAELLGLPLAALVTNLGMPRTLLLAFTDDLLPGVAAGYGLDPDPELERLFGYPFLHLKPASVDPVGGFAPVPAAFRFRHDAFEPGAAGEPPAFLAELDERPVAHATLGTVFGDSEAGRKVARAVLDGLAGEPLQVVLFGDAASYRPLPANTRVEPPVPYPSYLAFLARCSVLVSHGGYGTIMPAVANRLPLCFVPLQAGDQPVVANRFTELGIGVNCARAQQAPYPFPVLDPDQLRPDDVRDAVRRLLGEEGFATAVERLRQECLALPPAAAAVELLEEVARSRPVARAARPGA